MTKFVGIMSDREVTLLIQGHGLNVRGYER